MLIISFGIYVMHLNNKSKNHQIDLLFTIVIYVFFLITNFNIYLSYICLLSFVYILNDVVIFHKVKKKYRIFINIILIIALFLHFFIYDFIKLIQSI